MSTVFPTTVVCYTQQINFQVLEVVSPLYEVTYKHHRTPLYAPPVCCGLCCGLPTDAQQIPESPWRSHYFFCPTLVSLPLLMCCHIDHCSQSQTVPADFPAVYALDFQNYPQHIQPM